MKNSLLSTLLAVSFMFITPGFGLTLISGNPVIVDSAKAQQSSATVNDTDHDGIKLNAAQADQPAAGKMADARSSLTTARR